MPGDLQIKKWYLSKTVWTNLVLGVLVFVFPSLQSTFSPETLGSIFAIINIALRLITKDKLELY